MKTLVVGLGNPILGDDGIGWKVAEKIYQQLTADASVEVICLSLGGISLMEHLIGFDRAILVDAFASDEDLGSIHVMRLNDMPSYSAFHITSAHDTSLQNAIEMGRSLGAYLPEDIRVVGIATQRIYDFSEEISAPVAAAMPQVVKIVLGLLEQNVMV
ncbi:MAG: hydrogenase maturation protease [Chloroflexota bacterium]